MNALRFLRGGSVFLYNVQRLPIVFPQEHPGVKMLTQEQEVQKTAKIKNGNFEVADFGLTRRSKSYIVNPDKPMNLRWLAPDVYHTGIVRYYYVV